MPSAAHLTSKSAENDVNVKIVIKTKVNKGELEVSHGNI
jgi:hypothetical protein